VTGATLREFADRGRTDAVASVSLFGGAIPNDSVGGDGRYGSAIAAIDAPVSTFTAGTTGSWEGVSGLRSDPRSWSWGLEASASAPASYTDVDVIDLVADHYSDAEPKEGVYRGWSVKLGSSESARRHRDQ